ncbi:MAG: hypothetical protein B0D91_09650 [Oceanospirillales bacterium LUC14_002_19_P2]|nr:MAG: hypothetical protein B0D91_09650 [Oceanospirillales bacterium LUC14_002_19_P2]
MAGDFDDFSHVGIEKRVQWVVKRGVLCFAMTEVQNSLLSGCLRVFCENKVAALLQKAGYIQLPLAPGRAEAL